MIQASYCEVEKGGVFAHISSVSCCLLLVGDGVGGGSCLEGGILKGLVCMDLQLEKEAQMEALKSSLRSEAVAQRQSHGAAYSEETAWVVVEKGEGFSVDELLNLGEFGNNEQEAEEEDREDVKEAEAAGQMETENNSGVAATAAAAYSSSPSSSGSALSCEAPPPLPLPLSEMSLPAHDAEELEWVSFIIDDSGSEFPAGVAPFHSLPQTQTKSDDSAQRETLHQPHAAAAVAATQGASFPYSTVCTFSTEAPVPARAKRSKRSRTVAVGWSSLRFADSSSSTTTTTTTSSAASCSSASSSLSSCLIYDHPVTTNDQSFLLYESHPSLLLPPPPPQSKHQKVPKKRGRKPKPHADVGAARPSGERRCSHCGVQKTPQWRAGPLGAKTLCNACGVRFKSGRLLPEYRPACSPTFQNAIHSNSHRKVLEMRRKKEEFLAAAGPAVAIC